jgi:hypothetical protein
MKLKAISNMSVIFCLLKTPRLMQTEYAKLKQLTRGTIFRGWANMKKGADQDVPSNVWLWVRVLPTPL